MAIWIAEVLAAFTMNVACAKVDVVLVESLDVAAIVMVAALSWSVKMIWVSGNVEEVVAACDTTV